MRTLICADWSTNKIQKKQRLTELLEKLCIIRVKYRVPHLIIFFFYFIKPNWGRVRSINN